MNQTLEKCGAVSAPSDIVRTCLGPNLLNGTKYYVSEISEQRS